MKAQGPGEIFTVKKGVVLSDAKGVMAVVISTRPLRGVILEGEIDCMYRYCNFVKVKTRKGWKPKPPYRYLGWISGEFLEKAFAATGEEFGTGAYHHG